MRDAQIEPRMMLGIHSPFGASGAQRLPATRVRYRKAMVIALILAALFGARAFADEKGPTTRSFVPLLTESLLGLYSTEFLAAAQVPRPLTVRRSVLLELNLEPIVTFPRPLESLPLSVFRQPPARFKKFEPGIGQYFDNDAIGRSRISGAGLEENRWVYFKFKFRF